MPPSVNNDEACLENQNMSMAALYSMIDPCAGRYQLIQVLQGSEIAVNRLRECINAVAKSLARLPAPAKDETAGQQLGFRPGTETHITVIAESVHLQVVAACWKGEDLSSCCSVYVIEARGCQLRF